MPRSLGDVLHYLLPEADRTPEGATPAAHGAGIAPWCVPLGSRDVVRLALVWNLAVEAARQGARVALVAPATAADAPWPGSGPLGLETIRVETDAIADVARAVEEAARRAWVLAAVPGAWLRKAADAGALLHSLLVLARPEERESGEARAALDAVASQAPAARLGACIFGVRARAEAQRTFEGLAAFAERELGRSLVSYGALIDDVHLSRSIVTGRPIALAQPASAAARALTDVASMLLEDAPERAGRPA